MPEERRKHERIPTKPNASAMITDEEAAPSSVIVFSSDIIDISESGLGFRYSGPEKWPANIDLTLEIIDDEKYLGNIPIQIVADTPPSDEENDPVRRIGVSFGELSEEQKEDLKRFIDCQIL